MGEQSHAGKASHDFNIQKFSEEENSVVKKKKNNKLKNASLFKFSTQLIKGYWNDKGRVYDSRRFDLTKGGNNGLLKYNPYYGDRANNLIAWAPDDANGVERSRVKLVDEAFKIWGLMTGIKFRRTRSEGIQQTFILATRILVMHIAM